MNSKTSASTGTSLPRSRRAEHPPGLRITGRDDDGMLSLYNFDELRSDQIALLHFPSLRTAQERLMLLYHHEYVDRRFLGQVVYFLDERGLERVAEKWGLEISPEEIRRRMKLKEVRPQFITHRLTIHDVQIAMILGSQKLGWRIVSWLDERVIKRQMKDVVDVHLPDRMGVLRPQRRAVLADGYFVLGLGENTTRGFIEVDMGTEDLHTWETKVRTYTEYWRSGKYQKRYQTDATQLFRVFTVTTGERRMRNLKEATEKAGGKKIFWFTTLHDIEANERVFTASIWQVATYGDGLHPLIEP